MPACHACQWHFGWWSHFGVQPSKSHRRARYAGKAAFKGAALNFGESGVPASPLVVAVEFHCESGMPRGRLGANSPPAASPARRQVSCVGFLVLHCWRSLPSASPACRQVSWWVLLGLHGESGMPVRWWLGVLLRHRGESGMPAVRYAGGLRVCFILFFSIHLGGAPLEFRWLRHAAGRTPPCMTRGVT